MDGLIGGPEKKRMSSRKKQVLAYSIVLAVCYAAFWLFAGGMGAMGYSFLVQLFTLPLANFIIALFMGLDKSWKERQWWLLLYFGFGFFLMQYGTFSLANMLSKGSFNLPEWHLQKSFVSRLRRPQIEQAAQQLLLFFLLGRDGQLTILGVLLQQRLY